MISLNYKDTITFIDQSYDGYGDETIKSQSDVACLFLQSVGTTHTADVDILNSDAHCYVDPSNPFIQDNAYRLEGMLVKSNPFCDEDRNSWYRVTTTYIGQDKLLTNNIDNVHIFLRKSEGLAS